MGDPALPVQTAIVAKLQADPRVSALVPNGIFDDELPGNASPDMPYIVVGATQTLADFADDYDGSLVHLTVNVWSRAIGFQEAKSIGSAVREVLDLADIGVDGYRLVGLRFDDAKYLYDPDGISKHGVVNFTATVEPIANPVSSLS